MRRDRLRTILRLRELEEQRRLAEQAAARRALIEAEAAHEAADRATRAPIAEPGERLDPQALAGRRSGAVGLADAAAQAADLRSRQERDLLRTQQLTRDAAMARRSVERLRERREEQQARRDRQAEDRRNDETALTLWRRR